MPITLEILWRLFLALIPRFTTEELALLKVDCGDPDCGAEHYEIGPRMEDVEDWETYDAIGVFRLFVWLGFMVGKGPLAVRPWPGRKL